LRRFDSSAVGGLRRALARRPAEELEVGSLKRACVMIPLVPIDGRWHLLFSRRSPELTVHSGQISFPGGGANRGEDLATAALREMHEEVGVDPGMVEIIGRLDDVITRTGFMVAPFVGVLATRPAYVLQQSEVDEIFEVPVDELLADGMPQIRYVDYGGGRYPVYVYPTTLMDVWGLTGRILKGFLDVVREVV
jgi:8-oxo-dGTP pyrophosphatase MutT (NUDIX family)